MNSCRRFAVALLAILTTSPLLAADTKEQLLERSRAVLAQLDGQIRVPGLKAPVEILRDRWGIPHIYAQNQDDLFFAQGLVAAQDRLFQIDMWRRTATGETAEVLGEQALPADRFARLLRFRGDMEAEWTSYSPDTKRIAESFVAGINAYIDHLGDKLPIEFQLLGVKPEHWTSEDILGRMSGIIMTGNFRYEVERAQLVAAVGAEKARKLLPTDPVREFAPAPGLDLSVINDRTLADYELATKTLEIRRDEGGSNNWVVDGTLSASGKPLLANDPHRPVKLPSLRYLVHLNAPGWNVIGSGEPGLPGVAIGHNEHVAWGFTFVHTDQSDLYVEELQADDPLKYRVGSEWRDVTRLTEMVRVKGKDRLAEVELKFTRHGPIIAEDRAKHRAVVLRWVGHEPGTAAYLGSLALDRATSAADFRRAAGAWKSPPENLVYADVKGDIGWVGAALTPIRSKWDGLLPVPGASGEYEWQGFLAPADLPQIQNPAEHFIATANQNILPPGYSREIAYEWSTPYRYNRIRERLTAASQFTPEDFESIQYENTSIPGRTLAKFARSLKTDDARLKQPLATVAAWDGVLTIDSKAGPIYAVWLQELLKEFFRPHTPESVLKQVAGTSNLPLLFAQLDQPTSEWFGAHPKSSRDQLMLKSLGLALDRLEKLLPADPDQRTWGQFHSITIRHPLGNWSPEHAAAFNMPTQPRPGDGLTPNAASYGASFEQTNGASYREVIDLADWDRARVTSVPGQSGQPGSPHYADLLTYWQNGKYFPLLYSREKIDAATAHKLTLQPQ